MDNSKPRKPVKGAQDQRIQARGRGLAITLAVERTYTPDRSAMLAALRVLLGLQCPSPNTGQETMQ